MKKSSDILENIVNPKMTVCVWGGGVHWGGVRGEGQFDPPCGFSKNVSSKERVKPWFFMTFKIILKHIFPESFIEFPQVVQKI